MDIGRVLVGFADAMATVEATEGAKLAKVPEIPEKFNQTERVIAHMMRENTGASILDSGGAYGRAWQRNLVSEFWKAERASVEFRVYERYGRMDLDMDVTINLFHYLTERLTYDRALTRQFHKFANLPKNEDSHWPAIMEEFPEWIGEKRGERVNNVWSGNSYNEDNYLSGTIQYTMFSLGHEQFVALQIHGGCDVRGGYTAPKIFQCDENFGDWYRASIGPDRTEVRAIQEALRKDLETNPFLFRYLQINTRAEVESLGDEVYWDVGSYDDHGSGCSMALDKYPCMAIEERSEWRRGHVCVLPDRTALCPETGARLTASFF